MNIETIEADVLCAGGGIAGLMAAIRAADLGAKVVVAEKANTLRSGAGGVGNDHFSCYIPDVHGNNIDSYLKKQVNSPRFRSLMMPEKFWRTRLEKSYEMLKLWDEWGVPMKYHGRFEFAGHTVPGQEASSMALKYSGRNQKPVLTKQALKRGVEIFNRVMVIDLLTNDAATGAVGVDTREQKMFIFKVKSVILGTGMCMNLYPSATPAWMFNQHSAPGTTGDGRAMAFRAGVELVNMESFGKGAGPRYFIRSGRGTWVGVMRGPDNKPIGPFVEKPHRRYGDPILDSWPSLCEDYAIAGKGPVYMDCTGISDEDLEYQNYWLGHEGNTALINHLKEEGIDLKKSAVEFMTYGLFSRGGIFHNENSETSIKGLYAAGDEYVGQISTAAVFGWLAGENAVKYIQEQNPDTEIEIMQEKIDSSRNSVEEILGRENGASWKEALIALQQTMLDYAGSLRTEPVLSAGLKHLQRLRKKAKKTLKAENHHELMLCLGVLNLFDIGETVFLSAIERKETRGSHKRPDYPFTNPLMNKMLICRKTETETVVEWREPSK
ncbi:MAG: FAD-binding protein [Deltaproteobacteria bacterium]|nr:FAD-binding protein [Deltaproteobacteria bacterium]